MNVLLPLADACPVCHPGDFLPVLPFLVLEQDDGSLRAWYHHVPCSAAWWCDRDPEAPAWPLCREITSAGRGRSAIEPVTAKQAQHNRQVLERELNLHHRYDRKPSRPQAGAA